MYWELSASLSLWTLCRNLPAESNDMRYFLTASWKMEDGRTFLLMFLTLVFIPFQVSQKYQEIVPQMQCPVEHDHRPSISYFYERCLALTNPWQPTCICNTYSFYQYLLDEPVLKSAKCSYNMCVLTSVTVVVWKHQYLGGEDWSQAEL